MGLVCICKNFSHCSFTGQKCWWTCTVRNKGRSPSWNPAFFFFALQQEETLFTGFIFLFLYSFSFLFPQAPWRSRSGASGNTALGLPALCCNLTPMTLSLILSLVPCSEVLGSLSLHTHLCTFLRHTLHCTTLVLSPLLLHLRFTATPRIQELWNR